jgi:Carboxypeptidase regulatory-like domain/TonB dependent receptor-like, beta-barrel
MRSKMLFLVAMLLFAVSARAQYRASIQGVVTDPAGAVVSGATLTLTNLDTNLALTATSDENGVYNFNALPPAKFSLVVEKTGFKKKLLQNVGVIAEQSNALNIQLELGQVTESVTVSGDATPLVDTETASINGVVNSNQIQHLPSFGRDVLKLAQLASGAFGDGAQGGSGSGFNLPGTQTGGGASGGAQGIFKTENGAQVISNGQQTENNGVSIDGISTTSAVWGGSTIITPSEDSIDSVKIVTNSYDAEDGRFSGAQLQIISKSGTNDFHGSLFLTSHQPGLNAFQRFNGEGRPVTKDTNKFEQFGGSVGGPIWKNKIFAFFNYETVREPSSPLQGNGWFETPAFAALAPSGSIASKYLSFPGNGVVGTLNPNATCATAGLVDAAHATAASPANCAEVPGGLNIGTPLNPALFPLGNIQGGQDPGWTGPGHPGTGGNGSGGPENLGTVADIANYFTINQTKFTASQYNGRLDANVTEKDRVGFAIYWVPSTTDNLNGGRGYDVFHHNELHKALSAIWDHTISSDFLNEFRVNGANWKFNEIASNPQAPVGLPQDNILQTGSITIGNFGPNAGNIFDQWTYTFKDVATKIHGRHTIKFGGEVTRLFYLNNNTTAGNGVPNYFFFNIWDFLNDAPREEQGKFNPNTGFPTALRQDDRETLWGLFIQDDFKLRRNLTLNLGLRWSYFGPLSSKEGNLFTAFPGQGADFLTGLVVKPAHSWDAEKNNFGPQFGFAWSPTRFKDKLAIRGGYGLSYNAQQIAISANIFQNPGLAVTPTLQLPAPGAACVQPVPNCGILYALSSSSTNASGYPSNPAAVSPLGPNGLPTTGSVNVEIFPGTLPTTRTHHWSVDAQYDLGHDFVASVGYQGSLSRDTYFHENPLAVPATQGFASNPQIGGGDFWNLNGRANYNAMLLELKHRFSHEFSADTQFTWSKCMDTSSAPFSEQPYPFNGDLNYGRCDYNVGKAFKIFGVWQPVFFHNSDSLLHHIVDGWSLSGIFNIHSGFPWTPFVNVNGGNTYCSSCGYGSLFPTTYLGGAGGSTSNDAFKTVANSNFPNGGAAYFGPATYPAGMFGATLPPSPAVHRNSLNLPGYKDVDLTLAKGFGLPKAPVLGENARIELRMDVYNLFNNLNLDPTQISNNTSNSNFGTITGALAARVVTLGARFSF